jgi:hypothetical protein
MVRAGYLQEFGHSAQGVIAGNFTEKGVALIRVIQHVESEIGKLTANEAACLWLSVSVIAIRVI